MKDLITATITGAAWLLVALGVWDLKALAWFMVITAGVALFMLALFGAISRKHLDI